jgi:hypothetical protein
MRLALPKLFGNTLKSFDSRTSLGSANVPAITLILFFFFDVSPNLAKAEVRVAWQ